MTAHRTKRASASRANTNQGRTVRTAKLPKGRLGRAGSRRVIDRKRDGWKPDIDYRREPQHYRVGKGEQGVLTCERIRVNCCPSGASAPGNCRKSSAAILAKFRSYLAGDDFVGADMARKFLQMGYTRSRRYANYTGGRKYGDRRQPLAIGTGDPVKAESAKIFHRAWRKAEADRRYSARKKAWKQAAG